MKKGVLMLFMFFVITGGFTGCKTEIEKAEAQIAKIEQKLADIEKKAEKITDEKKLAKLTAEYFAVATKAEQYQKVIEIEKAKKRVKENAKKAKELANALDFDGYKIGVKFKNNGYQGKTLEKVGENAVSVGYMTQINEKEYFNVEVTKNSGIIWMIRRTYYDNNNPNVKDFQKTFENKYGIELEGNIILKGAVYHNGVQAISLRSTEGGFSNSDLDYRGNVLLTITDIKIMNELEATMQKQKSDKFKL